jgi:hypothetical protein
MRFMTLVKSTETSAPPPQALMDAIGKLGEEAARNGVMVEMGGLLPTAMGARVRLAGGRLTVTDGPFTEAKELIAGYWLWQVKSMNEAIEWVKRCPKPTGEEGEIEIRQVFEAEDFGEEFTPELREQEERVRAQAEQNQ